RKTDELRAYAIVEGETGESAQVTDAFGLPEALDDLFAQLVPALYRRGHSAIGFRFVGDPKIVALLASHGFVPRERNHTAVVVASATGHVDHATVYDPASWYLTELDV